MREVHLRSSTLNTFVPMLLAAVASGVVAAFILMLAVFFLVTPVHAQSEELAEVGMNDVMQGSLLFKTERNQRYLQAPTLHTDVSMNVTAMIARAVVKQKFVNTTEDWVEGVYVFPLPETAAVDHMRMKIGERVIEGQIKEKQEAKRIYNQAKKQGKKTSLLEQDRPNLFTTSVANIGPGEEIVIEIEYQQAVKYDQGVFSLRFPMTLTPRYIPGSPRMVQEEVIAPQQGGGWAYDTAQVPDASRITPPVALDSDRINPFNLTMDVNAGIPLASIESPYHKITTEFVESHHARIRIDGEVPADRDFVLSWKPRLTEELRSAHFVETKEGQDYHLIMMMPPDELMQQHGADLPREVVYVIDTSGSMEGASIIQAKQSLLLALDQLNANDRFNVIQFNSVTSSLFPNAKYASSENLRQAKYYVNSLHADGGTEMYPALEAALNTKGEEGYVRQVIFITDGSVGNETQLFSLIKERLGKTRLFTVGIGSAPNSYFMSKSAQFGRGTFTYIGGVNEVGQKMAALFDKLESPVMTNLEVRWPEDSQVEMWPKRLPDVYRGEPLMFVARTLGSNGELNISGENSQAIWRAKFSLGQGEQGKGVSVLWAREKIKTVMDSRHEGVSEEEVKREVVKTALAHHLVSKYTSLVAVDVTPTRPAEEHLDKRLVPNQLPHGSKQFMKLNRLAQTATPGEMNFLIGLLLLLVATLIWLISDRKLKRKAILLDLRARMGEEL